MSLAASAFPPVNPPPTPSLSRHPGIRILGIRRRCPRCFGDVSWPLCPQSDPDDLCLPGRAVRRGPRPDLYRSPVRSQRSFVDTRAYQMRSPPPITGHFAGGSYGNRAAMEIRQIVIRKFWVALSPVGDRLTGTRWRERTAWGSGKERRSRPEWHHVFYCYRNSRPYRVPWRHG